MRKSSWTNGDIDILKSSYYSVSIELLCAMLGKNKQSIYQMSHRLKLKKENNGRFTPGQVNSMNTQFKKGMKPWNTGLKLGASWANSGSFKKGRLPHNTKCDDEVTVRKDVRGVPYQFIRVSLGKWVHLHVHTWRVQHGDIPRGSVVVFKNGNTMDCRIENLELITRRENMLRNTIQRYPKELIRTIQTVSKLKRKLKTLEQDEKQN